VFAAMGGHLEVLQWLHANDCPWNEEELYIAAAEKGHETIVRALIELGADVNKARYSGATPLKWATRR
jgi:ankyrin repeat protein